MEVVIPKTMDFDFGSARSSPYLSAPSTPRRFGDLYFSAPTSPTRISQFYRDLDDSSVIEGEYNKSQTGGSSSSSANIPFDWEEKPGTPRSSTTVVDDENDFAFCVSEELEKDSRSAEELFDGGKIRPLKPSPRLQLTIDHHHHHHHHEESGAQKSPVLSPRSPISYGKKIIRDALSPRQKKETGPFSVENSSRKKTTERERGRERVSGLSSSSRRAGTRSLSPLRVSEFPWEEEQQRNNNNNNNNNNNKQCNSLTPKPPSSTKGCSRKWRLKDFLLFRSASEGRATDKDPFKKYAAATSFKWNINNGSFRSIDSSTPSSNSNSKRRGPAVSAHELHYTMNRAVSEDLKKKTFLPYKQGILGRLAFNPAVHALANGFGSLTR